MKQTSWDIVGGWDFKKALDFAYKTNQNQCGFLLVSLTTKENQRKSNLHGKGTGETGECEEKARKGSESLKSKKLPVLYLLS